MDTENRQLTAGLRPDDVRWYVLGRGWKVQPTKNPSLMAFNSPTDLNLQIQVPVGVNGRDAGILMAEVVRKLAAAENRPLDEVSQDIRHPFEDILRLRVQSGAAEAGTLPLEDGLKLLQGGRELLRAAACSAHQPQAYYLRKSYKPVEEFIERCHIGQTARGSYVATILSPPMAPAAPGLFDHLEDDFADDLPFERRVTLTLVRGLGVLQSAIQLASEEPIEKGVSHGVSADLCDALSNLTGLDEQANLRIEMGWSPVRPRVPNEAQQPFRFTAPDLAFIGEAGRKLRRKVLRSESIEGPIIGLKIDPTLLESDYGTVTMRAVIDGRLASVRFTLSASDYAAACNAHRDKVPVHVKGILRRGEQSKLFQLEEVKGFTVIGSR
jgi:hypothetical protein